MSGRATLTGHARWQAARRGIAESTALGVAVSPEQILVVRSGREVRQSLVTFPNGARQLVRVVVDTGGSDMKVVTVYRTSKVAKYWGA
jgi:hypothetical protein